MPVTFEQFVKQLEESGVIPSETLQDFIPPRAAPKSAEDLAKELVCRKKLTKFQVEEISRGKGRSLTLGNYVLMEKIGAGGMGQVFKARHRRMDRLVAVKLLPAAMMKDAAAIARFEREVKAAAKLRHMNIIAADDADEAHGVHFLVMELVEGSDLSALVKKNGPLPVEKAVSYIIQAARGLEFAHQRGVIHRDIKPANLLVDGEGTVKILDMGLARIEGQAGAQAELTSTGAVMGTVDYMAPEQALNTKAADARSDVYSLGISLWYLLTGKCAYDGDTLMAKLLAHRDAPIPSLCAAMPDIPPAVDAVFQKMVAKQAQDRFQTISEVIGVLEGCRGGSVPAAGATVPSETEDTRSISSRKALAPQPTTSQSATGTRQAAAPVAAVDAAAEATLLSGDPGQTTDPQTLTSFRPLSSGPGPKKKPQTSKRKSGSVNWWRDRRVQIGGVLAVVLIMAVVILLKTPKGTLRVEILDPEVEVQVQGTNVTLKKGDTEPVTLTVGEKKLLVTRGELSFETESFVLKKGEETRVRVELLDDKLLATSAGKVLGETVLPPVARQAGWHGWPADAPPPAIAPFDAGQAKKHQAAWSDYLKLPVEYTNSIGMKFVLIPPGEFMMGSTLVEIEEAAKVLDDPWKDYPKCEAPQHRTILTRPVYLGVYEVTQGEYEQVMGMNPSAFARTGREQQFVEKVRGVDTSRYPVEMVRWSDVTEFCMKLSEKESLQPSNVRQSGAVTRLQGNGYGLASEAEWEFACRAGTATVFWFGNNGENLPQVDWYGVNSEGRSHQVGELKANPFGLYDMHGNVWEWVQDWWDAAYYAQFQAKPAVDPSGPAAGEKRVFRGGGWDGPFPFNGRSAYRPADVPTRSLADLGFRVALSVDGVRQALKNAKVPSANGEASIPQRTLPLPLKEINSAGTELNPWVSADGLEIFWCVIPREVGFDVSQAKIYSAHRPHSDAAFEGKKLLFPGHSPVVSADCLEMIFCNADSESFSRATRQTKAADFGPPVPIPSLSFPGRAPAPRWLTDDGLTMYLELKDNGANGLHHAWATTRSDKSASWTEPELVSINFPGMPAHARFVFESGSADNLHLYCLGDFAPPGGHRDLRLGVLSRQEPRGPFTQWQEIPLTTPTVKQPLCWRPLFVPQTRELFLISNELGPGAVAGGGGECLDIYVIKNFRLP